MGILRDARFFCTWKVEIFFLFSSLGILFLARIRRNLSTVFKFAINTSRHKAEICLQLGIRPKFRNKWSRETALMRLRAYLPICAEALTSHLAGVPDFTTTLDRQCVGKRRHIAKEERRKYPNFKGRKPYRLKIHLKTLRR